MWRKLWGNYAHIPALVLHAALIEDLLAPFFGHNNIISGLYYSPQRRPYALEEAIHSCKRSDKLIELLLSSLSLFFIFSILLTTWGLCRRWANNRYLVQKWIHKKLQSAILFKKLPFQVVHCCMQSIAVDCSPFCQRLSNEIVVSLGLSKILWNNLSRS